MSRSQRSPWLWRIHIGAASPADLCASTIIFFSKSINSSSFPGAAWIRLALYKKLFSCAALSSEQREIITSQQSFRIAFLFGSSQRNCKEVYGCCCQAELADPHLY